MSDRIDRAAALRKVEDYLAMGWTGGELWEAIAALPPAPDAVEALVKAAVADALDAAAIELDQRGQREQVDFGLVRATQNFYRARDLVRARAAAIRAGGKAMTIRGLIEAVGLRVARAVLPNTHVIIQVCDAETSLSRMQADLINGGNALERGWGCSPAILFNVAAFLHKNRAAILRALEGGEG